MYNVQGRHYTIVARCDGFHGVLYTRGWKWHPRRSRGNISPRECTKTPCTPSLTAWNNCFVIPLYNNVTPLLEIMLSSSNIITTEYEEFNWANSCSNKKPFFTVPSNPWSFRTKRWKTTNAGNDQGDVHRFTSLMLPAALCSRGTCVFVAQHVIGSRPIKLHSLLPRYNNIVLLESTYIPMSTPGTSVLSFAWFPDDHT